MKDEETPFSSRRAFKKTEVGGYDLREEKVTAFIDRTSHNSST
jgi:hypothetical protein